MMDVEGIIIELAAPLEASDPGAVKKADRLKPLLPPSAGI